jgi:effector-binding domain-containing protein
MMPKFRTCLIALSLAAAPLAASAQAPAPAPAPPPVVQPVPPAPEPTPQPVPQPAPPVATDPVQPAPEFGLEVQLVARPMLFMRGTATWDGAWPTLVGAFRKVSTYIGKNSLAADGAPFVIYTQTDDNGFEFQAAIPIKAEPRTRPRGEVQYGLSPAGKALRFAHEGSYAEMDQLYEAIANYLDERQLESRELFIEEYAKDPLTTPEGELRVFIFVPLK